jgi:hypothetical protein
MITTAIGLTAGALVAGGALVTPHLIWWGAGLVFAAAFFNSLPLLIRMFGIHPSGRTIGRSVLLLIALYPLCFAIMVGGAVGYSHIYRLLAPERWWQRASSGRYVDGAEGILVGLCLAAVVAALGFALVLRWLSGRWKRGLLLWLIVVAVLAVPVAGLLARLFRAEFQLVIFPVGGALLGAVGGAWLQRSATHAHDVFSSLNQDA